MSADLSIISLVTNASLVVQLIMLLLLLASVYSWMVIFRKLKSLGAARRAAADFEDRFWSSEDLTQLYGRISQQRFESEGMERIFKSGFREYARLRKQSGIDAASILAGVQRAMSIAMNRELDDLENQLPFLATVGSTSPYVGLFGTVWGIMNSFHALGNVHQATLAMVAPGISEALVATAMGLFAAIPAVIAYNRYANDVERLNNRYEIFMEEFSAILHRQVHV